jgi:hypothetical protein
VAFLASRLVLPHVFRFIARLLEAGDLLRALESAGQNLLDAKRRAQEILLEERNKVIP